MRGIYNSVYFQAHALSRVTFLLRQNMIIINQSFELTLGIPPQNGGHYPIPIPPHLSFGLSNHGLTPHIIDDLLFVVDEKVLFGHM